MKRVFSILAITFTLFFYFSGCSYVTRPSASTQEMTWEEVEAKYHSLEKVSDHSEIENLSKELMVLKWAKWQQDFIKFKLAKALFNKNDFAGALETFNDLKGVKPFVNETHLLAGESALKTGSYDEALKWVLSVYLKLSKEEKVPGSKTVFLAYLYSKRVEKAAAWYALLDDVKKENIKPELDEWMQRSESNRRDFNNYLSQASGLKADEIPEDMKEEILDEMKKLEEIEEAEKDAPSDEISYDESYTPDWNKLCVLLSNEEKWTKFNEVITFFMTWYFQDFRKTGIELTFLNYLDEKDISDAFAKAGETKCFALAGPFFAPEFGQLLHELSVKTSIPVVSYFPEISSMNGIFFNVMPTKDLEAENILNYAVNVREKKKFAIAYLDNRDGRMLRDTYWKIVEDLGGTVTEIIDLSPADNAFFDDVEKVVGKPDNFDDALRTFRWKNKEKFNNETMMKRAIDRFLKTVPGKCNFDALIVLTPVSHMPMLLPSFPYMNVEFEYYQRYLNRNVSVRKHNLRQEGFDWDIQQILVLAPSEVVSSEKVVEQLGQIVDGMIVFAPVNEFSEKNQIHGEISKQFSQKNGRNLYYIENFVAEVATVIFNAHQKAEKKTISELVLALKENEIESVLSGTAVKFDDRNRMTGRSAIMIGRNKEPFMTPAQIEEEEKRKEELKKEESGKKPETPKKKED